MAHAVRLETVEEAYSKRRRGSVCRRTRIGANTGACLSQERVSTRERGIAQEVSGRGVLFGTLALGGLCQIVLCRQREGHSLCTHLAPILGTRGRVVGGKTVAERGTRPRGRARGGGQDRRPTDNNSLQLL